MPPTRTETGPGDAKPQGGSVPGHVNGHSGLRGEISEARATLDKAMSEDALQQAVIDMARFLGWRVAHFRPARTATGWRTPVEADGKGFFDLVMMHRDKGLCIFAELKREDGQLSDEQDDWFTDALCVMGHASYPVGEDGMRCPVSTCVWRPHDLSSGEIERVLRGEM